MFKSKKDFAETLLFILIFLAFRSSIIDYQTVPTGSLEPTVLPGDRIISINSSYHLKIPFTHIVLFKYNQPKRGDIISFDYPKNPSVIYLKRLIGVPGDIIDIHNGYITVNGVLAESTPSNFQRLPDPRYQNVDLTYLEENLLGTKHLVQRITNIQDGKIQRFIVPENQFFFMGDNRDDSNDSRFWGFVPEHYLIGKVPAVLFSLNPWIGFFPKVRWERTFKSLSL